MSLGDLVSELFMGQSKVVFINKLPNNTKTHSSENSYEYEIDRKWVNNHPMYKENFWTTFRNYKNTTDQDIFKYHREVLQETIKLKK